MTMSHLPTTQHNKWMNSTDEILGIVTENEQKAVTIGHDHLPLLRLRAPQHPTAPGYINTYSYLSYFLKPIGLKSNRTHNSTF
jgi:hypothetical protein